MILTHPITITIIRSLCVCVCVCVLSHICPGSREVMLSEFAAGWLSVQLCFLYRYEHQCKYGYSLLGSLHIRWQ